MLRNCDAIKSRSERCNASLARSSLRRTASRTSSRNSDETWRTAQVGDRRTRPSLKYNVRIEARFGMRMACKVRAGIQIARCGGNLSVSKYESHLPKEGSIVERLLPNSQ